ncbi:PadR family transcriptional regulator [Paenibacillus sp. S-38]|uniref:PadR family transcriptional regulator n=1 Tax=Paenibacillus sp. S-38 TaxID=3416710 RepID=UPI003CE97ADE
MKHDKHHSWKGRHSQHRRSDLEGGYPDLFLRHRHDGPRGGFGGRGEGKRFFERGQFKFALLELLAAEPMHGYQLIKAMEDKTGGLYSPSPGSVYPNLQLLEDMQLIGSSDADGKKLYHITKAGEAYLREREEAGTQPPENRWDHHGRHGGHGHHGPHGKHGRHGGRGKHELRGLMKDWSDAVFLMAKAAEAAKEAPSSKQAAQFQELMGQLQESLKGLLASIPESSAQEPAAPPTGSDSAAEDSGAGQ